MCEELSLDSLFWSVDILVRLRAEAPLSPSEQLCNVSGNQVASAVGPQASSQALRISSDTLDSGGVLTGTVWEPGQL